MPASGSGVVSITIASGRGGLGVATPLDRVGVRSALGLAEYSVEAWAELVVPGPPIVVTRLGGAVPSPPPRPDAILIETTPDPEAGVLP